MACKRKLFHQNDCVLKSGENLVCRSKKILPFIKFLDRELAFLFGYTSRDWSAQIKKILSEQQKTFRLQMALDFAVDR